MTTSTQEQTSSMHSEIKDSVLQQLNNSTGASLEVAELRTRAFKALDDFAPPTPAAELWRYTSPRHFPFHTLPLTLQQSSGESSLKLSGDRSEFEVLENPSSLGGLKELFASTISAREQESTLSYLANLHMACTNEILIVRIPRGKQLKTPMTLSQFGTSKVRAPLIFIVCEAQSRATLIDDVSAVDGFYYPRLEVVVGDGAELDFVSIQQAAPTAKYLARHRFHIGKDVNARLFHAALGASVARVDLDCRMYQAGSSVNLFGLYIADGKRHVDFHSNQEHLAPNCHTNLYYKGVAKDQSRAVYYGFIRVAEGAQKTDAYQSNKNMILSESARVDSIPNLNIKANDVKCSHGSSTSQVGPDELFYMMSRGLDARAAEHLIVEGFFEDLLLKVSVPEIQARLRQEVLGKLQYAA